MRGLLVLIGLGTVSCGDNLASPALDAAPPDATRPSAAEYFGLRVGAHWVYRKGTNLSDKRITSCEQVAIFDCIHNTTTVQRVWVRETRERGDLRKVHYLRIEPGIGVVRLREDDYETGTRTWVPYEVRVIEGPYGHLFSVTECEPGGGKENITQSETIVGMTREDVLGQTLDAEMIVHRRTGDVPLRDETSWYVPGIGEVRQRDQGGSETRLVSFEPGLGDCP